MWKQSYNACPTLLYSIDIGSVSVFAVQIDDTSDENEVSTTAGVWLILCASLVCMLFSSKLVIVVVSLKEVCEFIQYRIRKSKKKHINVTQQTTQYPEI